MNLIRFILAGSAGLFLVAACGGATSGSAGGNGGAGSGSCTISAGTYTQQFTAVPGGTNCPNIPSQTFTLNATETTSGGGESTTDDAGNGCVTNVDDATCTFSTSCTSSTDGFTSSTSTTFTFSGDSATGKETSSSSGPMGTLSSCTYDITMTKT